MSQKDNRGCYNIPRAKSENINGMMNSHISSFPYCVHQYGSQAKQRYLRSDLDVMQFYIRFLEKQYPETYFLLKGDADAKHSDVGAFCEEYSVKIGNGKREWSETKGRKELVLFSDVCICQNHNITIIYYFLRQVYEHRFSNDTQMLPVRGYSFLPCVQHFAVIEKMKRRVETMEMYEEWVELV
ncbi:hypothetical protein PR048_002831 [Dryococelus australis]|uniref:Uncharacterized protein n=1 Tax=Dryococelus australis TaxID=614101 RepID=A0ABQ9ILC5_9NEOP|nr:hypothetical protein PR048_002831 [Dryococelus australis]